MANPVIDISQAPSRVDGTSARRGGDSHLRAVGEGSRNNFSRTLERVQDSQRDTHQSRHHQQSVTANGPSQSQPVTSHPKQASDQTQQERFDPQAAPATHNSNTESLNENIADSASPACCPASPDSTFVQVEYTTQTIADSAQNAQHNELSMSLTHTDDMARDPAASSDFAQDEILLSERHHEVVDATMAGVAQMSVMPSEADYGSESRTDTQPQALTRAVFTNSVNGLAGGASTHHSSADMKLWQSADRPVDDAERRIVPMSNERLLSNQQTGISEGGHIVDKLPGIAATTVVNDKSAAPITDKARMEGVLPVQTSSQSSTHENAHEGKSNSGEPRSQLQHAMLWEKLIYSAAHPDGKSTKTGVAGNTHFGFLQHDLEKTSAILRATQVTASHDQIVDTGGVTASRAPGLTGVLPVLHLQTSMAQPGWSQEVGQRLFFMLNQNMQSAELQLHPKHLGPMEIKISGSDQQFNISFIANNHQVKDALDSALPRLREMFAEQGLNLGDVNVSARSQQQSPERQAAFNQHRHTGSEVQSSAGEQQERVDAAAVTTRAVIEGIVDIYA